VAHRRVAEKADHERLLEEQKRLSDQAECDRATAERAHSRAEAVREAGRAISEEAERARLRDELAASRSSELANLRAVREARFGPSGSAAGAPSGLGTGTGTPPGSPTQVPKS
jgi:hypothetical protein